MSALQSHSTIESEDPVWVIETVGPDSLRIVLRGDWVSGSHRPARKALEERLQAEPGLRRVLFDGAGVRRWDTMLPAFLAGLRAPLVKHGIELDTSGLPHGVRGLLTLAFAVPPKSD